MQILRFSFYGMESFIKRKYKIGKSRNRKKLRWHKKFSDTFLKKEEWDWPEKTDATQNTWQFYTGGLQKFDQYTKLKPIDKSIGNNEIIYLLARYQKHKYRFITTSLLISSSFIPMLYLYCVTVQTLQKKHWLMEKFMKREGVTNLTEIYNLQNIKGNSR